MALMGGSFSNSLDGYALRLADYCCRCGKMFVQNEPLALITVVCRSEPELPIARPAHREDCVSSEDQVLMLGVWHYDTLELPLKPKGRR